jgi:hypothetical protein
MYPVLFTTFAMMAFDSAEDFRATDGFKAAMAGGAPFVDRMESNVVGPLRVVGAVGAVAV